MVVLYGKVFFDWMAIRKMFLKYWMKKEKKIIKNRIQKKIAKIFTQKKNPQ